MIGARARIGAGRRMRPGSLGLWAVLATLAAPPVRADPPPILLADEAHPPRVTVSWPDRSGTEVALVGERKFQSPGEKTLLGRNIECYVALGGVRIDRAAGDPDGAVVRVGLAKINPKKPLFEGLADDASVTIKLERVRMNQPAVGRPRTGLIHLRYLLEDLDACGISSEGRNQYITAAKDDKALGSVRADSTRPGALDGQGEDHGSVTAETAADGSTSITFKFPYALLRHLKDPSKRTAPGGYLEPQSVHCEIEMLPKDVAAARDAPTSPAPTGATGPTGASGPSGH